MKKHWVEKTLDAYDQSDRRPAKVRDYFSPSSVSQCPRAVWYHMMGYQEDATDSGGLRRMGVGSVYHEWIQEKLQKAGVLVSAEVEVTHDSPPMKGFYDGIIRHPETGEDYLIEIKSRSDNKYAVRYLPRPEHLVQWNLYSLMTNVVKGLLFYVNKNTQAYNIYETQRDESILEKIINKMWMIQGYVDRKEIVPYQPDEKHDWCNFRTTCEKDYLNK
tara:strand:- start:252 stop:902 length:651 start_codon:yes stop_codon:yes gene_type:complete